MFPTLTSFAHAYETGDNYPYKNKCAGCHTTWWGHDHTDVSVYGFFYRQCTDFAAYCLNARNEVYFVNSGSHAGITWGDAKDWGNFARTAGYVVDQNPAVGAVAYWVRGDHGHVAWVSAVNGSTATIEEYNYWSSFDGYPKNPGYWNQDTLPRRRNGLEDPPSGYIHFPMNGSVTPSQPTAPVQNLGSDFYAYISNSSSGLLLENRNSNVQLASPNGYDPRQIWHFQLQSDNQYKITSMYDGRCIDASNWGTAEGTNIQVCVDSGNGAQRWLFCNEGNGGPYYVYPSYISNQSRVWDVAGGSLVSGANIQLWTNHYQTHGDFNGEYTAAQRFQVHQVPYVENRLAYDLGENFYARIGYKGSYLETTGTATESARNMDVQTSKTLKSSDPKQIWHFTRLSDGSYKIVNEYNDWCLDVYDGNASNGTRVRTYYNYTSAPAQKWYIVYSPGDSSYRIASSIRYPSSLYSLDIPAETTDANGIPYDGCGIQICQQKEVANQQFDITNINYTKPAAPAAPTNIRVNAASGGTTITWDPITPVNQYDTRRYYVFLEDLDATDGSYLIHDYSNGSSYTTDKVLQPGRYKVMLQAVNTAYYRQPASSLSVMNFSISETYTIQVSAGTGGTVSGGGVYNEGDRVTVTATPDSGYQFSCWRNAANSAQVSTSTSYTFDVQGNLSLIAEFTKAAAPVQTYTVRISAGEGGTVSGGGSYKEGASVTVRAEAASGYDFVNWLEDGEEASTDAVYTFTIGANRSLAAVFAKQDPDTPDTPVVTHTVHVNASPAEGGIVAGGGTYEENASVTVTATANDGYQFVEWRENSSRISEDASFEITVDQDRELTAVFEEETGPNPVTVHTIRISATDGGTATGSGVYQEGDTVTVRAEAANGYRFIEWTEDGSQVSEDAAYTFEADRDRELLAVFERTGTQTPTVTAYDIRVSAIPAAGGTVTGGGIYLDGDTVTVTAASNGVYRFVGWAEDGVMISEDTSYTFAAGSSRTLTAVFETETGAQTHTIRVEASPAGGGTVTGGGSYQTGEPVTITAVPGSGYRFVEWRSNDIQISTTASYTFTASADQTFTAVYEEQSETPSYTISVSASPPAGGTVRGGGSYEEGTVVTVSAAPNRDYRFVRWTENGNEVSKTARYTFTVNAGHMLIAEFTYVGEMPVTPDDPGNAGTSSSDDDSSESGINLLPVGVGNTKNGSVTVSTKRAGKGDKVTLVVQPDKGYTLSTLTVKDGSGKVVTVTKENGNQYSFIMPVTRVSINAVFTPEPTTDKEAFSDISNSHWASAEISWASENGVMGGYGDGTFQPENQVTRQQAWMVLGRMAGADPADMAAAWNWAVTQEISDGTTPGNVLTRQQLVTLLYRYAQMQGYKIFGSADIAAYPDSASVAVYAREAMAWAVGNGIIAGTSDGRLNPGGTATRAQFAVIIHRFDQKIAG